MLRAMVFKQLCRVRRQHGASRGLRLLLSRCEYQIIRGGNAPYYIEAAASNGSEMQQWLSGDAPRLATAFICSPSSGSGVPSRCHARESCDRDSIERIGTQPLVFNRE